LKKQKASHPVSIFVSPRPCDGTLSEKTEPTKSLDSQAIPPVWKTQSRGAEIFASTLSRKFAGIFLFEEIPDEHHPPVLSAQAHQGKTP
jgi:hypothetical protein